MISASYVVGNKVDDNLHSILMSSFNQLVEFLHSLIHINCEVGIDVVVVLYRIRRTCSSLDYIGIVERDAERSVVGNECVFDDSGVPHVSDAQVFDCFEGCIVNVVEFPDAILL